MPHIWTKRYGRLMPLSLISKINSLQANIEAQIQKLKDYRRILIHDAVTGKIKI